MPTTLSRTLAVLAAGAALVIVPAGTAFAETVGNPLLTDDEESVRTLPGLAAYDDEDNWLEWLAEVDYEGGECETFPVNGETFVVPDYPSQVEDWVLAVVKSVGDSTPESNDLVWWPIADEWFWHETELDIAHVILCSADFSDETVDVPPPPPPPVTTTTPPVTTTTPPVTTTTTPPVTTTTTPPVTTTTTPPTGVLITRLAGVNRYDTARLISQTQFGPGVPVVYLTTGTLFPDALAVGALAGAEEGPILLTLPGSLPAETAAELQRLQPQRIVLLGQTDRVSAAVEQTLVDSGYGPITRIAGDDRYETAALISQELQPTADQADRVYLATGLNFPDSLAAAAIAARDGDPLLLTGPSLHPATSAELTRLNPSEVVILGSVPTVTPAAEASVRALLPAATVNRVGGPSRYATAAMLSEQNFAANSGGTIYISTGMNFPDSLAAGPVAGLRGAPVLLVPPTGPIPQVVLDEVARLAPANIVILGSTATVSAEAEAELAQ